MISLIAQGCSAAPKVALASRPTGKAGVRLSGFDIVFALFGLVLGLAITEVLAGFSRVMKVRRHVRVGWLVPVLGLVVLLDLTSFWSQAADMRNIIPGNLLTMMIVLAIVGAYYLIATLIFPDDPASWPDFDDYYDLTNRKVLGGMLAINLISLVASGVAFALAPEVKGAPAEADITAWQAGFELAPVLLILALLFVKNRRANFFLLVAMAIDFVAIAVAEIV